MTLLKLRKCSRSKLPVFEDWDPDCMQTDFPFWLATTEYDLTEARKSRFLLLVKVTNPRWRRLRYKSEFSSSLGDQSHSMQFSSSTHHHPHRHQHGAQLGLGFAPVTADFSLSLFLLFVRICIPSASVSSFPLLPHSRFVDIPSIALSPLHLAIPTQCQASLDSVRAGHDSDVKLASEEQLSTIRRMAQIVAPSFTRTDISFSWISS